MGKVAVIFVENKAGHAEGIAVAMARVVNAVIGKKNKTWLAILCLKRRHHPPLRRITAPIPGVNKYD